MAEQNPPADGPLGEVAVVPNNPDNGWISDIVDRFESSFKVTGIPAQVNEGNEG